MFYPLGKKPQKYLMGGGGGGGGPGPLFVFGLRPEGPKKIFFLDQSPPPYLRVWITVPPPLI